MSSLRFAGRASVAILVALLLAPPAPAWNFVTHRVIAAMAYDQLTPSTRARVDAIIRNHPDYATRFVKNAPADESARARAAFIEAAVWGDAIRSDPRFYDETQPGAVATPYVPGFPDMQRHPGWHFIDLPFSQDGTALEPAPEPNLVTELSRLIALSRPRPGLFDPAKRAYDLVWLIHLTGDIHAPLHCVSRFSASNPHGDQGGNLVFVTTGNTGSSAAAITLHKYWDDALGVDTSPDWVDRTAAEILHSFPPEPVSSGGDLNPQAWAKESLDIARKEVYSFGTDAGSSQRPVALSPGYGRNAHAVARAQAAKAAARLAAALSR